MKKTLTLSGSVVFRCMAPVLLTFGLLLLGAGCEEGAAPLEQVLTERIIAQEDAETPVKPPFDFGSNDTNVYVCFGDSITDVSGYPEMLDAMLSAEDRIYNEGIGGEESADGLKRVNGVLQRYRPGYLLILFGANDLMHTVPIAQTAENLHNIIRQALAARTLPVIATVTPQPNRGDDRAALIYTLNSYIIDIAMEENIPCADLAAAFEGAGEDLFPDGIHPNAAGARIIATTFYEVLRTL